MGYTFLLLLLLEVFACVFLVACCDYTALVFSVLYFLLISPQTSKQCHYDAKITECGEKKKTLLR